MRRVRLMGAAAVAASSLAFAGAAVPAVASAKTKPGASAKKGKKKQKAPKPKPVSVTATCKLSLVVAPPADQPSVVPPQVSGTETGGANCGNVGTGLASLMFKNNQDSGETTGSMSILTGSGGVSGKFTLEPSDNQPPPTAYSFGNADLTGTATVTGGTGTLNKAKGKGTLVCNTIDSVHYSCVAKLKITLPPVPATK